MRTVVFANQKGGIGKSALATHQAFYAAEAGKRVLVLDIDGQGTTTNNLLPEVAENSMKASGLFSERGPQGTLQRFSPSGAKGEIAVLVADDDLNLVDENPKAEELRLRSHLQAFAADFDLCVIDPPPTLGKRLRAALKASDFVVMPFVPVRESTDGLGQLLKTIEEVRQGANPRLQYVGFLANKVNSGSAKQKELLAAVKEFAKDLLLSEQIVERAAVADMLAMNRPVWKNQGGESHRRAAVEMTGACKAIMRKIFK